MFQVTQATRITHKSSSSEIFASHEGLGGTDFLTVEAAAAMRILQLPCQPCARLPSEFVPPGAHLICRLSGCHAATESKSVSGRGKLSLVTAVLSCVCGSPFLSCRLSGCCYGSQEAPRTEPLKAEPKSGCMLPTVRTEAEAAFIARVSPAPSRGNRSSLLTAVSEDYRTAWTDYAFANADLPSSATSLYCGRANLRHNDLV